MNLPNLKYNKILICLFVLLFGIAKTYGQGSRNLYPGGATGNRAYLVCTSDAGANENSWPYLTMGTHYVYAKQGEVIAAAFSARSRGSSNSGYTDGGRIRITAPNGTTYITGTGTVDTDGTGVTQFNNGTGGLINNRAQELAGPYNGDGNQGSRYTPFAVTVPNGQTGVWRVEFFPRGLNNTAVSSDITNIPNLRANAAWDQDDQPTGTEAGAAFVAAWDVSVRSGTTWIPGRVYTNVLNLLLPNEWEAAESFYADMYVLTKDGIAYKVSYNGNQGAGWTFFTNNKGFIGPDGQASYKSLNFSNRAQVEPYLHDPTGPDNLNKNYITHKMFYAPPASDLPNTLTTEEPLAPGGGLTTWLKNPRLVPKMTQLTFEGVEGTAGQSGSKGAYIRFNSNVKGLYKITIPSTIPKVLTGPCDLGMNEIYWDGTDGNGNPLPAGTSITEVSTQLHGAEVHFPYIDMEINPNGIVIQQLDNNYNNIPGMDRVYWDDTDITGGNPSRDSDPRYNGNTGGGISSIANGHKWGIHTATIQNPSGVPTWTGQPDNDGTGNGDFGNTRSIDTWSYAPGDVASAALQIVVMATDLRVNSVTKVSGPNVVSIGNNLTYEVSVFNNGPSHATTASTKPATFFFYAPPGITINPASVSFIGSVNGAAIAGTKTFDPITGIFKVSVDMPNQGGGTFRIPVTVTRGVPDDRVNVWGAIMRPEDITDPDATNPDITIVDPQDAFEEANGVHKHSSELPVYTDPSAINLGSTNNIKLNDAVQMYANVAISKTVTPPSGHALGQQVTFTITATNNGISTANYVKVTDLLGPRYAYVSHTVSTGTYSHLSGLWNISTLANGATATMTITATITANGGEQVNTATITADEFDTVLPNNTASATTNAPSSADLQISKTGFRTSTFGGETNFTITVKNNGPSEATNVVVTDVLSGRYDFTANEYIASAGTVNATGTQRRNIIWTIPSLANGAVATMVFIAQNNSSGSWDNTASVTRDQPDPVSSNNSVTITPSTTGTAVNLAVTKQVSNATPNVGDNITFTVTASRVSGTTTVNNVVVTDVLPAGYTYVTHSTTQGSYDKNSGQWAIGTINSNANRTLIITVKVNPSTGAANEYRNIAAITGTSEADGVLLNNIAEAEVSPPEADIEIDKKTDKPKVKIGKEVKFTLKLKNKGPHKAQDVNVQDILPSGYTFLAATATMGSFTSGSGLWDVGEMEVNDSATLTITAKVNNTGELMSTATAESTTYDPAPYNNSDGDIIIRENSYLITNPMIRSGIQ